MNKLRVEVGFDLICPWCLIGKRELERAVGEFARRRPDVTVEQRWHSLQLLPTLPDEGLPFREFYLQRLGSAAAVAARQAQVRQAGRRAGVEFDFESLRVMPNTAAAHALVNQARAELGEEAALHLIEELFTAHFHHSADLGDVEMLGCMAESLGLDPAENVSLAPYPLPGSGVPLFIFNGREVLSGAQPAEQLLAAMERSF